VDQKLSTSEISLLAVAVAGGRDDEARAYLGRVGADVRDVAESVLAAPTPAERSKALVAALDGRKDAEAVKDATLAAPPDGDLAAAFGDYAGAPPLPQAVRLLASNPDVACPWLDRYIEFSRRWSPRSFDHYHETVAIWLLSTVAAKRIYVDVGGRRHPSLYAALVGHTSLYAKTTAARIATDALEMAGLSWLLGPDDCTPQRLIVDLKASVPDDYDNLDAERQAWHRNRAALAAQRGFYLDEFGRHIASMMREGSVYADFRGLLRQLDDCPRRYIASTIARGESLIDNPYISILACLTPRDLRPFARRGSSLWGDGFLARFALVCPPANYRRGKDRFPAGERQFDAKLAGELGDWNRRLGVPDVSMTDVRDNDGNGKPSKRTTKRLSIKPLVSRVYPLDNDVREAFDAYNDALLDMVEAGAVPEDLAGNYSRFAEKALRVSLLLASMGGDTRIRMKHWARAQAMAERWRDGLHHLYNQVNDTDASAERQLEERVLEVISRQQFAIRGATATNIRQYIRNVSTAEAARVLDALKDSGELTAETTKCGTKRYKYAVQEES
jgi:hypothetical protein